MVKMNLIKSVARRIPGLPAVHRWARETYTAFRDRGKSKEEVLFSEYFASNTWGAKDSRSGGGSDLEQTRVLVRELPALLRDFQVASVLDIPCGDFYWMRHVDMGNARYIGADVVGKMIRQNQRFANERRVFRQLNLLTDDLPAVDLIVVRDCLVHFPYDDIRTALANIRRSGSRFLLTTTFPEHGQNHDIEMGDWCPLNLEREPFCLPRPNKLLLEGCTENDGKYADKSMGLWEIEALGSPRLDSGENACPGLSKNLTMFR